MKETVTAAINDLANQQRTEEIMDIFEKVFAMDERIVEVRVYHDGWVPNAYRWRAPGAGVVCSRGGDPEPFRYNRKRSFGKGPHWVGYSAKGGRLASG